METNSVRQELHQLLDRISDSDVVSTREFLRSLLDPVAISMRDAPYDDEGETERERAIVEAARSESGPGTPHEEVLKEFGL